MSLQRHVVVAIATAICTSLVMVIGPFAGSASADGFTDRSCHGPSYVKKNRLVSTHRKVVLTHLRGFSIPPTSSHRVTKRTRKQTVVRAGARISGGASTQVGNKIISKAEVRMNLVLRASGAHTSTKAVKVTDRIANRSRRNATFAFYSGVTKAFGTWKSYSCATKPGTGGSTYVYVRKGRWSSFEFADSGAVRCGAGTRNISATAKAALRRVCG